MNDVSLIDVSTAEPVAVIIKRRGRPPGSTKAALTARAAIESATAGQIDQKERATQVGNVDLPKTKTRRKAVREPGADLVPAEAPHGGVDARFTDPLVAQIVQAHRMRRRWMKARNALILQAKAFGRAIASGGIIEADDDKRLKKTREAGTALYDAVAAGKSDDPMAIMALLPFVEAAARFDADLDRIEKDLAKLAKKLPIAQYVAGVSGFGLGSLAAFVGECGDISAYPRVSGVWKRAGLAVIDGERQRKCADAEKALLHGYSPERRSVFWIAADAMSKHQRAWIDKETGEIKKEPGPFGVILESTKAKALEKGWTPARAEAHGKRLMTKALLKELWIAWRKAKGTYTTDGMWTGASDKPLT